MVDERRGNVDAIWSSNARSKPQLIVPDGCLDVIERRGKLFVVGPMTRAKWVDVEEPCAGIRFRPGAVSAWLGVSPKELLDVVVAAHEIPALREAGDLTDVSRVARRECQSPVVQHVLSSFGRRSAVKIERLAAKLSMSDRHLRRICLDEAGLSPRFLARVHRLQSLIGELGKTRPRTLTQLAQEVGYADQAHMNHEVRKLCGVTPRGLRDAMSESFKT